MEDEGIFSVNDDAINHSPASGQEIGEIVFIKPWIGVLNDSSLHGH